jgi:hypothetical protein
VWRYRERVEHEAADQVARLAIELEAVGAHASVVELARAAADDETTHAALCRSIVDHFEPGLAADKPQLGGQLGVPHTSRRQRALYACVAISCITETLSAALLLQMRERAQTEIVRDTVHHILKDEIDHSRIGWAHLADEARRSDVAWLAPHIDAMLRAAMTADLAPMSAPGDLSAHGILPATDVACVFAQTVDEVIRPGLERFGISGPS